MSSSATTLTLVRHGETSANIDRVWHGSTDSPLTPRGHQQAQRVARYLERTRGDAVAIYTSPLARAIETANEIGRALDLVPSIDVDLAEYDLGSWEGKTFAELQERHRLWDQIRSNPDFAPKDGESPRQVSTRTVDALRRIAAGHPAQRVVVVSHGGALTLGLHDLVDGYTAWRGVMDNCGVSDLVLEPDPRLLCFNETAHLDGL